MKTLLDPVQRSKQLERLKRLSPQTQARWGNLSSTNLVPHLTDPFRIALGEYDAKPAKSFWSTRVGQYIAIYLTPQWPKDAPTHPKTDITKQGRKGQDFDLDMKELLNSIDRFMLMYPKITFYEHPIFGKISNRTWAIVMNKHMDHHFRQFGL
jgi:hypothetical protein